MNGFDDVMGLGAEPTMREKGEALIGPLHVFQVVVERYNEELESTKLETLRVVGHSMNIAEGKLVVFTLRFVEPNQLVSFVTRVIGGAIFDAEDLGVVPESRIIH